jgi:hypothetical protein
MCHFEPALSWANARDFHEGVGLTMAASLVETFAATLFENGDASIEVLANNLRRDLRSGNQWLPDRHCVAIFDEKDFRKIEGAADVAGELLEFHPVAGFYGVLLST